MLHNPKWDKQTKTPSRDGFILWLETKDPSKRYEWSDCNRCAVTQYLDSGGWRNHFAVRCQLEALAIEQPRTFGALLERARKAAP